MSYYWLLCQPYKELFLVFSDLGKDVCVDVTTEKTCVTINETDVLITMSNGTTLQKTEQQASEYEESEKVGKKSEQLNKQFDLIKT